MSHFPSWLSYTEATIINRLISLCFKRGYFIEVRDYEAGDVLLETSSNRADIQRQTAATGGTIYRLYSEQIVAPSTYIGSIILIHGNEEDVISDASWPQDKPDHESIINELCDQANG